MNQNLGNIETK